MWLPAGGLFIDPNSNNSIKVSFFPLCAVLSLLLDISRVIFLDFKLVQTLIKQLLSPIGDN